MDSIPTPPSPPAVVPTEMAVCPVCHQLTQPQWYFCPNCGKALTEKPLSTSTGTQAWIYAFSIIMPWIAFLGISHWPGVKYIKSSDEAAKQIGIFAAVLMGISTIIAFWLSIVWIQNYVQSSVNSINLSGLVGG